MMQSCQNNSTKFNFKGKTCFILEIDQLISVVDFLQFSNLAITACHHFPETSGSYILIVFD